MRNYSSVAAVTQITSGISAGSASMAVAATTGFPSTPFTVVIDPGVSGEEIVTVTGVSGLTLSIDRGQDDTTAVSHIAGATVRHMVTARDLQEPQDHIAATTNIHGVTGGFVGTTQTQTLTNKTMSGSANSFSDIPQASVTGLSTIATNVTTLQAHPTATTGIHGVSSGSVVGTTLSQTLTNKTMSGALNTFSAIPQSAVTNLSTIASYATTAIQFGTEIGFNPIVNNSGGAVWTQRDGRYAIVGNLVFIRMYLASTHAGSGSTPITITVPIDIERTMRQIVPLQMEVGFGLNTNFAGYAVAFSSGSGSTFDRLRVQDGSTAGRLTNLTGANINDGTLIAIQGFYRRT